MKRIFSILWISIMIGAAMLPLGCGSKAGDHGKEESPSGASFKEGKGITLRDETSKILGLEIADVAEEPLPQVVKLSIQIFSETRRLDELQMGLTKREVHGSGFLPSEQATLVKLKQPIKFFLDKEVFEGFVVSVQKPIMHGETEIIVGITTVESKLKDGDFVRAEISIPRNEPVTVIPSSALLRTIEGTFVYAVNGNAYYKIPVKVGNATDEKIEITDGLYAGDQVVANPVETLWLIELRATKGGGHSC